MPHFFEKRDPWGNGISMWILIGMVFLAPLAWWSVKRIDLNNNIKNWLPADDQQARVLHWFEDHFGIEDRILVSWDGSVLGDPRIARLKKKLVGTRRDDGTRRDGLIYVQSAVTPADVVARMISHKIDSDEAIKRLKGVLIGNGPLRIRLSDSGRRNQSEVVRLLRDRARDELNLSIDVTASTNSDEESDALDEFDEGDIEADDEFEDNDLAEELFVEIPPHDLIASWPGMHLRPEQIESFEKIVSHLHNGGQDETGKEEAWIAESFFVPGSPIAVSVTLSEEGKAEPAIALKAIRQAAFDSGISAEDLHLGGRPVAGSELNQQVKKAAWDRAFPISQLHNRSVILLSALVAAGLALVVLKSFRLAVLVLLVSVYTTLLTVALVPATNGDMNMVLVVMPTLLMVLTVSASIHVVNYWKHAAIVDMKTAVVEAAKMAKQPCILASVTTAIGLISLTASPLSPVSEFGLYSAIGCLISLAVVLFGLPALLQYFPAQPPDRSEVDATFWHKLAGLLTRFRTPVTIGSIALFCACSYGLHRFRTETKVIRYFPDESRLVQDYHFLEDQLAGIIPVESVIRFDKSAQRELNFLERMELVREIQNGIRHHPEISGTISLADFQPVTERLGENATFPQKVKYNKRASLVETRVKEGQEGGAASFLTVADTETDLKTREGSTLCAAGDELWRITAQVAILSDMNYKQLTYELDEIVRSSLKYHPGAGHVVTGMVPLFLRTQEAVLESLIISFALAFGVIAIVMSLVLKNPISGLITMLPNVLPIGVVFGLISWYGLAVDIGTMITASVALGIAVDGTLHLITWFRLGISAGKNRGESVALALAHCGPAMWQTSAAVGLGLLMLYPADLLLISRFGWLMAALIGAAFLSDLIFLPALLAGPLGALIEKIPSKEGLLPSLLPEPELVSMHLPLGSPDATALVPGD